MLYLTTRNFIPHSNLINTLLYFTTRIFIPQSNLINTLLYFTTRILIPQSTLINNFIILNYSEVINPSLLINQGYHAILRTIIPQISKLYREDVKSLPIIWLPRHSEDDYPSNL